MPDQEVIEHELTAARQDLEHELGELKDTVRDKLDLKQRARQAARRSRQELTDLGRRVSTGARDRPGTALAVLAGLTLLIGAAVFATRRRSRWRW